MDRSNKPKTRSDYKEDGSPIFYPDVRVMPEAGDVYVPTRGFGYTLVVLRGDHHVGFVKVEDLGFDSVKEYLGSITTGADQCASCGRRFDATPADKRAICSFCKRTKRNRRH
jgi:hypothetical protein